MSKTYQEQVLDQLKAQNVALTTIMQQLRTLTQASAPQSPDYRRPLASYKTFDWAGIGADVIRQDAQGVCEVEWNQHRFIRRSGSGKFGTAIWFSRAVGQTQDGVEYAVLIRFKDYKAEPMAASFTAVNGK